MKKVIGSYEFEVEDDEDEYWVVDNVYTASFNEVKNQWVLGHGCEICTYDEFSYAEEEFIELYGQDLTKYDSW